MSSSYLRTDPCIAFPLKNSYNRKSAIIFQNSFILAPAVIIYGCLSSKAIKVVSRHLATFTNINATSTESNVKYSETIKELRSLRFQIVHKRNNKLITSDSEFCYLFNCRSVSESVDNLLDNFEPLLVEKKQDEHNNADLSTFLMSSFVVLSFADQRIYQELTDVFTQVSRKDSKSVERLLRIDEVRKLDDLAIVSTPFTNEVFFGNLNVGKVANVFGIDDCLVVASPPLVGGCEGGAVYNRNMNVVGIVICTSFRWKHSQHASLTLVASFREVVSEFLRQSSLKNIRIERTVSSSPHTLQMEKSVIFIQVGGAGGTGCFLKIANFRFVLTCSHVVFDSSPTLPINCYWSRGSFASQIIFKNPKYAEAYDLALLTVPVDIPDDHFTECQTNKPNIGDLVYSTGFPHFFALAKHQFAPSLFEGRITKVDSGLMISDASVQAGQSGGPILNASGKLMGIMVSNCKDSRNNEIYPHTNMCVPIFDVYPTLEEFAESRDITVLDGLLAEKSIVRRWNLQPEHPSTLSKL